MRISCTISFVRYYGKKSVPAERGPRRSSCRRRRSPEQKQHHPTHLVPTVVLYMDRFGVSQHWKLSCSCVQWMHDWKATRWHWVRNGHCISQLCSPDAAHWPRSMFDANLCNDRLAVRLSHVRPRDVYSCCSSNSFTPLREGTHLVCMVVIAMPL